jgi:UDP-N-acetylglucosamine 1-carboxyvinyltransferase
MTGGEILVTDCFPGHFETVLGLFSRMGCRIKKGLDYAYLCAPLRIKSLKKLTTDPYPGFPTDLQAQVMDAQCVSEGICTIKETIFNGRDKHIKEFRKMGADIEYSPGTSKAKVRGVAKLRGAEVAAADLRAGAALILAGLAAEGETVVTNSGHVERGYEKIEAVLSALGAKIRLAQ